MSGPVPHAALPTPAPGLILIAGGLIAILSFGPTLGLLLPAADAATRLGLHSSLAHGVQPLFWVLAHPIFGVA